jgi:glycosyltransferase involved in cell wall biosynthesis
MQISILLPYKENFSPDYAGAVSLFVKDTTLVSKYKNNITIFGNTNYKKKLLNNYINIPLNKKIFDSGSKIYVQKFLQYEKNKQSDILEIHNRPAYIVHIHKYITSKIVLYFHNDPLSMLGSKSTSERLDLINKSFKIIFNSEWSKKRFLTNLDKFYHKSHKLEVIHQSTNKVKVDLNKKKKIITFVGKLNTAKGYDLFGKAIIKILNKHKEWKSNVVGDEPREKLIFKHKRLNVLGFLKHNKVLNIFKETSIAVACSRWEEPFGRTSLEASSRGCAVIISNRGGLPETITNGIIVRNLNVKNIYNAISKLILNNSYRLKIQKLSVKNFYLSHSYVAKKIDKYRSDLFKKQNFYLNFKREKPKLKILHVTNFNERHNGRLFYNTGRRINNGFIRLNHSVLEFSDRDIVSYYRSINDLNGSKKLNQKLIDVIANYVPDLLILGHADLIKKETLHHIQKSYPSIKIAQWFLDRMDSQWVVNRKRFLDKINLVDCSFCTTYPDALNLPVDKKIFYIPNPADESFENLKVYNNKNYNNDVFFAMSHGVHRGILKKGKFDKRENFINNLIKKTPNIKFDVYGMNDIQPIWADNYVRAISQSKMGLNLSQGLPIKYYSSDRLTQLIGNGLLTFIDIKTSLNNFFDEDEVVFYKSISDLSEKIIKYSNDDVARIKIAKKGKKKYLNHFNSKEVADYIITKTLNSKSKKFFWDK